MKNLPKINLVLDALLGMAYYIFLKSLRSLEEFRKNPHVKIPPKYPCENFQSLGKFKKSNF
jgi:CO dehydrogenase/acetyl-CoA synthase epsilon subunit